MTITIFTFSGDMCNIGCSNLAYFDNGDLRDLAGSCIGPIVARFVVEFQFVPDHKILRIILKFLFVGVRNTNLNDNFGLDDLNGIYSFGPQRLDLVLMMRTRMIGLDQIEC